MAIILGVVLLRGWTFLQENLHVGSGGLGIMDNREMIWGILGGIVSIGLGLSSAILMMFPTLILSDLFSEEFQYCG